MEKPLINDTLLLEKYPGKGGWTYVVVRGIPTIHRKKGGTVCVNGTVDDIEVKDYNLFPLKNRPEDYFFPIKSEIRKEIKKEAGDTVRVVLWASTPPTPPIDIHTDLLLCLEDCPAAHKNFAALTKAEQQNVETWITSAKTEDARVERIAKTIDMLEKHLIHSDWLVVRKKSSRPSISTRAGQDENY